ncbi:MAG TPA: ferrochelatase [Myxococcales bacterium]|jgi:ferrochelatase
MANVETAVVLMNLGGPDKLEDVEGFLFNIFSDPDVIQLPLGFLWQKALARRIARKRAHESQENYKKIGGKSPILELTRAQGAELEKRLGPGFKTYIAMRAWTPSTEQAVEALVADGAKRIVAFPLYPHRTRPMSVSSVRELYRVLKAQKIALPVHEVCCFPKEPGLLDAWAENLRQTLAQIPEDRRAATHVLFSAHGLPQSLVDQGDPYLEQVKLTVAGVMERVGQDRPHSLAFQSRATGAKWLEPATPAALADLAKKGVRDVAVVPIAFVTEHVETLFELDLLIKDQAAAAGLTGYHRVPVPNVAPKLMDALADLVRRALERPEPLCTADVAGWPCPHVADPRRR